MADAPVERSLREVEEEALHRSGIPRARFRMLFSSDRTPTENLTCGVALVGPDSPLSRHRHAQAEVYYGLQGMARVTAGDRDFSITERLALFIPGNVEHAVHADEEGQFFFAFAADSYSDIKYIYLDEE